MNVVGLVTAGASTCCFAMLFSRRMALIALQRLVGALQFKI